MVPMILYMYIAPGQGQITSDDEISMLIKSFCYFNHFCKFQKDCFELWFYIDFCMVPMILYMYIAPGQGQIASDDKIPMQIRSFCYFNHFCKFQKDCFELWFYIDFFMVSMILYMYIAPGQGQRTSDDKISMLIKSFCYFNHFYEVSSWYSKQ